MGAVGGGCETFEQFPGRRFPVLNAPGASHGIVKNYPDSQPLLFDGCNPRAQFKVVNPDCSFFVYANQDQVNMADVLPLINVLRQRNILVVRETESNNGASIFREIQDSYFRDNGSLINKHFADDRVSPDKMATAGFLFCGNARSDVVRCYFNRSVEVSDWGSPLRREVSPMETHWQHCPCPGFSHPRFTLPYVISPLGDDLTDRTYRVIGNGDCQLDCREMLIVSYLGCPLQPMEVGEFMAEIEQIKLQEIKQLIDYKKNSRLKDEEYFDLLRLSLHITHFSVPFRQLAEDSQVFVGLLEDGKAVVPEGRYCQIREIVTSLSSLARDEQEAVLEKLVNLEKSRLDSRTLDYLGDSLLVAGREATVKRAKDDLDKLARSYSKRHFLSDVLNDLVSPSGDKLTEHFPKDGGGTKEQKKTLEALVKKGVDLVRVLNDISQQIKKLLDEPRLAVQEARASPGCPD